MPLNRFDICQNLFGDSAIIDAVLNVIADCRLARIGEDDNIDQNVLRLSAFPLAYTDYTPPPTGL
jgi:hypothetical protein